MRDCQLTVSIHSSSNFRVEQTLVICKSKSLECRVRISSFFNRSYRLGVSYVRTDAAEILPDFWGLAKTRKLPQSVLPQSNDS